MSQQDHLALVTTILPEASAGRVAHILDAPGNNSFFNHLFVQINAVAVHIYMARSYFDSDKKKTDDTDSPIWALFLKHDKVDRKKGNNFQHRGVFGEFT